MQIILNKRDKVVTAIVVIFTIAVVFAYMGDKYQPVKVTKDVVSYAGKRVNQQIHQANAEAAAPAAPIAKTSTGWVSAPLVSSTAPPLPQMAGQHVVKKGETLWGIARAHEIPPKELLALNGMDRNTKLYPGQMISVPK